MSERVDWLQFLFILSKVKVLSGNRNGRLGYWMIDGTTEKAVLESGDTTE